MSTRGFATGMFISLILRTYASNSFKSLAFDFDLSVTSSNSNYFCLKKYPSASYGLLRICLKIISSLFKVKTRLSGLPGSGLKFELNIEQSIST